VREGSPATRHEAIACLAHLDARCSPCWPGRCLARNSRRRTSTRNSGAALIEAVESADSFVDRYDAEVWLTDMSRRLERRCRTPTSAC
jgi:hypothetical protein